MTNLQILKRLVREYQEERYGPPAVDQVHDEAIAMCRAASIEDRYWYLWASSALMNQEQLFRYWKKRKPSAKEIQRKTVARAKALTQAMEKREKLP